MSHDANGVAWPPTRSLTSSRFKSLEPRVCAVSALMAESEASGRAEEPFGRLTVVDHDTRASKIYTRRTDFQKHMYNIAYRYVTSYSFHIHDPLTVITLLIMRHRRRDLSMVDRGIDCTEHDFDDKICAEGRLCLIEEDRIHHVLINTAISFHQGKDLLRLLTRTPWSGPSCSSSSFSASEASGSSPI
jgi:hypothetical protein